MSARLGRQRIGALAIGLAPRRLAVIEHGAVALHRLAVVGPDDEDRDIDPPLGELLRRLFGDIDVVIARQAGRRTREPHDLDPLVVAEAAIEPGPQAIGHGVAEDPDRQRAATRKGGPDRGLVAVNGRGRGGCGQL